MSETKHMKMPLPQGWKLISDELEVAGVQHHMDDAISLLKGKEISFEFEAEPRSEYDANAIKVIGIKQGFSGPKRFHIGYVPKEVAAGIASQVSTTKAVDMIAPRLTKVWFGDRGALKIFFDIAVQKENMSFFSE